jgi:hypothetical protein
MDLSTAIKIFEIIKKLWSYESAWLLSKIKKLKLDMTFDTSLRQRTKLRSLELLLLTPKAVAIGLPCCVALHFAATPASSFYHQYLVDLEAPKTSNPIVAITLLKDDDDQAYQDVIVDAVQKIPNVYPMKVRQFIDIDPNAIHLSDDISAFERLKKIIAQTNASVVVFARTSGSKEARRANLYIAYRTNSTGFGLNKRLLEFELGKFQKDVLPMLEIAIASVQAFEMQFDRIESVNHSPAFLKPIIDRQEAFLPRVMALEDSHIKKIFLFRLADMSRHYAASTNNIESLKKSAIYLQNADKVALGADQAPELKASMDGALNTAWSLVYKMAFQFTNKAEFLALADQEARKAMFNQSPDNDLSAWSRVKWLQCGIELEVSRFVLSPNKHKASATNENVPLRGTQETAGVTTFSNPHFIRGLENSSPGMWLKNALDSCELAFKANEQRLDGNVPYAARELANVHYEFAANLKGEDKTRHLQAAIEITQRGLEDKNIRYSSPIFTDLKRLSAQSLIKACESWRALADCNMAVRQSQENIQLSDSPSKLLEAKEFLSNALLVKFNLTQDPRLLEPIITLHKELEEALRVNRSDYAKAKYVANRIEVFEQTKAAMDSWSQYIPLDVQTQQKFPPELLYMSVVVQ